jgi:hypothetical protein
VKNEKTHCAYHGRLILFVELFLQSKSIPRRETKIQGMGAAQNETKRRKALN